ncbi:MAG: hypothetical protein Q8M98_06415 [Candidatus Cloacimonadaceae bacterium]|nr:hypothetical protein [Candidatus Cloacimonadaceae bacterium]
MSWLQVKGKLFVCINCDKKLKVEYEGGNLSTLIGDDEVSNQLNYSEQFGQIESDPNKDGYYLYDFGVCSNCYNNAVSSDHKKYSITTIEHNANVQRAKQQCYQLVLNEVFSAIPAVIDQVTYETIVSLTNEEIHSADVHAKISDKHVEKRVKSYWHTYKDKLVSSYVELMIAMYVNRTIVSYVNEVSSLLDSYSKKVIKLPFYNSILIEKKVSGPENLNNYIESPETTRFPVSETPYDVFYNQINYGLFSLYEDSKIDYDDIVSICSQSIDVINNIKAPIIQVLRQEGMCVIKS